MRILHQYGKRYVDVEEIDDYLLDKQIQYEQNNVLSEEVRFIKEVRKEIKKFVESEKKMRLEEFDCPCGNGKAQVSTHPHHYYCWSCKTWVYYGNPNELKDRGE